MNSDLHFSCSFESLPGAALSVCRPTFFKFGTDIENKMSIFHAESSSESIEAFLES